MAEPFISLPSYSTNKDKPSLDTYNPPLHTHAYIHTHTHTDTGYDDLQTLI